jgi:hypothetical protein
MRVEGEARSQPHTQISVRPLALWHSRSLGECDGRACGPQRSELRWCPRGRPSLARRRTAPAERSRLSLSRRCGYPGTRVALWSKCGHASAVYYAQRTNLVDRYSTADRGSLSAVPRASREVRGVVRLGVGWRGSALATATRVPVLATRSPPFIWPISVIVTTTWQPTAVRSRPCRGRVERSEGVGRFG